MSLSSRVGAAAEALGVLLEALGGAGQQRRAGCVVADGYASLLYGLRRRGRRPSLSAAGVEPEASSTVRVEETVRRDAAERA